MKKIAIEKESLKSLDVISLQSNLLFMKKKATQMKQSMACNYTFQVQTFLAQLTLKIIFCAL